MNVYKIVDDGEHHTVIAESEDDAAAVMAESGPCTAASAAEYRQRYAPAFTIIPPDQHITIDDDGVKRTLTAAEWVARDGRGLLGSSVY